MKKSILELGRVLNKKEQKNTFGGADFDTKNDSCDQNHDGRWVPGCPCTPGFSYTVLVNKGGYITSVTKTC
ncbi:hypothetical protein ABMY20_12035 [Tenacibaculum sp. SSH1-16]|uniref:hypothetical protein n=1 Tax=Tenacibaculum sp. SSH1-16 TaxID=3136667 RepID=UPI0032C3DD5F|nr:hypothetical protein BACT7_13850 [Tenacibaculum mesophilum]